MSRVCVCVCVCEDARGEGDGKSSEVTTETPPPSKKMKDEEKSPHEPIEGLYNFFQFKKYIAGFISGGTRGAFAPPQELVELTY